MLKENDFGTVPFRPSFHHTFHRWKGVPTSAPARVEWTTRNGACRIKTRNFKKRWFQKATLSFHFFPFVFHFWPNKLNILFLCAVHLTIAAGLRHCFSRVEQNGAFAPLGYGFGTEDLEGEQDECQVVPGWTVGSKKNQANGGTRPRSSLKCKRQVHLNLHDMQFTAETRFCHMWRSFISVRRSRDNSCRAETLFFTWGTQQSIRPFAPLFSHECNAMFNSEKNLCKFILAPPCS
jgi:hypothetical protein